MDFKNYQKGNAVFVNINEKAFTIKAVAQDKVSFTDMPSQDSDWFNHDSINGIPLSENALRALGFVMLVDDNWGTRLAVGPQLEYNGVSHYLYVKKNMISPEWSVGLYTIQDDAFCLAHPPLATLRFVHELQNYYYNYVQDGTYLKSPVG